MLLAEELALIALDPGSGRHALGTRDNLNACLAGLLVAEVQLADRRASPLLDAAAEIVADAGPKTRTRIDHALDASSLLPVAESVRRVLADAAAAVAVSVVATTTVVTSG